MSEPTAPAPAIYWTLHKLEAGKWKTLFEDGAWRLHGEDAGDPKTNTQALLVAVLNLQPHRFTFRYRAAAGAVQALLEDDAEGVRIDRHPALQ